jgi:hypothetical protein
MVLDRGGVGLVCWGSSSHGSGRDMMEDEEDGPVVILALAAAQWEAGRLDARIKKGALKIIEKGIDFRWQDSDRQEERRVVLKELAAKLATVDPHPAPRRRATPFGEGGRQDA